MFQLLLTKLLANLVTRYRGILHEIIVRGWQHLEKPVRLSARRKAELLLRYGLTSAQSLLLRH